ncbi:MAG: ZIP family metal transporter [Clostridia bacterium]|nr:ZIP family metal transporter [Clostridia bacterium]
MTKILALLFGVLLPFAGTSLGAAVVYTFQGKINEKMQKNMLGFAGGIMLAASVWSLLLPSLELSGKLGKLSFLPASVGLFSGSIFVLLINRFANGISENQNYDMLFWAVTIHNIPEGMAVGVVLAGMMSAGGKVTGAEAVSLIAGIALQNFPEGAIISAPLAMKGVKKSKAFFVGSMSGAVEPVFALITFFAVRFVEPLLPFVLAFAAGAMIYVVADEIIPDAKEYESESGAGMCVILGFMLMMILDVALG